jgi:cytochrome c peroxidase
MTLRCFLLPLSVVLIAGCAADDAVAPADAFAPVREALTIEPTALPNYAGVSYPAYFPALAIAREVVEPAGNPITDAGATLGRVLFFDRNLSRTNTLSCASCHFAAVAFGDTARFSLGFDGVRRTGRHSMRLVNARFNEGGSYFWDRRAATLEEQTTQPIRDELELGFDAAHGGFAAVQTKLSGLAYYPPLFTLAFGNATITEERVQRALAQYVRSLVSFGSRWDAGVATLPLPPPPPGAPPGTSGPLNLLTRVPGFTDEEFRGQQLYMLPKAAGGAGCQTCHVAPSFSLIIASRTNGLDADQTTVFRSPSLKNVAQSRRFMHDGRFASLEEVVEFYNSGIQFGAALDNRLRDPALTGPQRLNLSAADKAALVAFLRTLTDPAIGTDPRFMDPFRR